MTAAPQADPGRAAGPSMAGLVRPFAPAFAAVVILQVIGAVAGLAPLLAVVELGRALLAPGPVDHGHVRLVVAAGAAGLLVRLLFTAASSGIGHLLDGRVQLAFRRLLAARLGQAPIGWFSRRRTGELAKVVGEDVAAVHPFIAHTPGELISAFAVPLVALAYLFTVDWRLTLITLIPVALAVALVPLMMTPSRLREQREFDAAMAGIANSVVEFVQGIAVVKAFGGGPARPRQVPGRRGRFRRQLLPDGARPRGDRRGDAGGAVAAVRAAGRADRRDGPDHERRHGSGRPAALPAAGARAHRPGGGARPRFRRHADGPARGRPDPGRPRGGPAPGARPSGRAAGPPGGAARRPVRVRRRSRGAARDRPGAGAGDGHRARGPVG
ncbi:ABC transporter ATP-binding protein/permease [Actinomadura madurae]|uniref:ABC transporter transmembrane domain-containing protein n=1 Tax=Actinomadura madurae TaxID=1993 RepID=UPI0020D24D93|nr:ABC transporter ATP-binding protein [Actinomadura madurae]MCP9966526.1 ABC transporter ATP-binding protein/permease [Actinomadura madurae]